MITLITGGPGTGKTAWLIDQLIELRKTEPNKLLFIHGVRNLTGIAHEKIYCNSQLCDICRAAEIPLDAKFVENWPDWKQSDSVIVVDEVQRIWRPRTGGAAPLAGVSTLETHRHYGVDFWIISQGPHLFDNFIRLLVGRHVHLVSRWSGRTQYEWPECKQDVQSRNDAVIRPYKLPSHVYKMYHSAEVHTVQNKRKPLSFYATIGAIILAVVMVSLVGVTLSNKLNPKPQTSHVETGEGTASPVSTGAVVDAIKSTFPDYKPQLASVAESAPAYAALIKVTSAPTIIGCVKTPEWCRCYTTQATPYPTTPQFCSEYVAGNVFNPYRDKKPPQDTQLASNTDQKIIPPEKQ
jgi:zona occludens toxin